MFFFRHRFDSNVSTSDSDEDGVSDSKAEKKKDKKKEKKRERKENTGSVSIEYFNVLNEIKIVFVLNFRSPKNQSLNEWRDNPNEHKLDL